MPNLIEEQDCNSIDVPEDSYLYTDVSQIPDSGNGLLSAVTIYKGEIIALFKGEILTDVQAKIRAEKGDDKYFINMVDGSIMDCMQTGCFAKHANDADGVLIEGNPGSVFKNNAKIGLDDAGNVCLIASRKIQQGEEIFCSYGKRYWKRQRGQLK
jgi:hypothetical protein